MAIENENYDNSIPLNVILSPSKLFLSVIIEKNKRRTNEVIIDKLMKYIDNDYDINKIIIEDTLKSINLFNCLESIKVSIVIIHFKNLITNNVYKDFCNLIKNCYLFNFN